MRIAILAMAALIGAIFATDASAAARAHPTRHRRPVRARVVVPAKPAHHMSALAAAAHRDKDSRAYAMAADRDPAIDWKNGRTDARLGAFKRSYKLDVYRPTVRPDEDGAVGLSLKLKSH